MHVGREPRSAAYRCDPYDICSVEKMERVLKEFPNLKNCVPHLGLDEISAYQELIEKYDNLWLDTAMAVANCFPIKGKIDLSDCRSDRVMYASDFPNIPYAWGRELKLFKMADISYDTLERILYKNATDSFSLNLDSKKQ